MVNYGASLYWNQSTSIVWPQQKNTFPLLFVITFVVRAFLFISLKARGRTRKKNVLKKIMSGMGA